MGPIHGSGQGHCTNTATFTAPAKKPVTGAEIGKKKAGANLEIAVALVTTGKEEFKCREDLKLKLKLK